MEQRALIPVIVGWMLMAMAVGTAAAGTVTGVTVSPVTVTTGTTASFTVTGTNPCGAAHLIYGDGTAITYAITGLPTTHTHAYDKPGSYTVIAKGMGNCDGEATTKVTVTGPPLPPPAPPPPAAAITAVDMMPNPARVREPVTIAVTGQGACAFDVQFGDGNAQEVNGRLPQQVRHTYSAPQTYTVIVRPNPPCTGKFTERLQVVDPSASLQRITRLGVQPSPAEAGQPVAIVVDGSGRCAYSIEFGDGNNEARTRDLPDRVAHVYPAGTYSIAATPEPPCTGFARTRLEVRSSSPAGVSGVEVTPNPVFEGVQATIQIKGTGTCDLVVDFGDGNRDTFSGELPRRVTHAYPAAGRYTIRASAERPCSGSLSSELVVVPRR